MGVELVILIAAVLWVGLCLAVVALCRAAAAGDRALPGARPRARTGRFDRHPAGRRAPV
jgi:hypothetical protein